MGVKTSQQSLAFHLQLPKFASNGFSELQARITAGADYHLNA
jgi:hypothetical protein